MQRCTVMQEERWVENRVGGNTQVETVHVWGENKRNHHRAKSKNEGINPPPPAHQVLLYTIRWSTGKWRNFGSCRQLAAMNCTGEEDTSSPSYSNFFSYFEFLSFPVFFLLLVKDKGKSFVIRFFCCCYLWLSLYSPRSTSFSCSSRSPSTKKEPRSCRVSSPISHRYFLLNCNRHALFSLHFYSWNNSKRIKPKNLFFISLSSSLISFDTDEALEQVFNSQQSLYLCILFKGRK